MESGNSKDNFDLADALDIYDRLAYKPEDVLMLHMLHNQIGMALDAISENTLLRKERDEYKKKYSDLFDSSIQTSEITAANLLRLALDGQKGALN